MANYIPHYGKKIERLVEHEREFVALLHAEAVASRLADGAEAVRAAQIRALRAKRAQLAPSEKNSEAISNLDHEIQYWTSLTVEQVIEGYRNSTLRSHRATAVRRIIT
jgi:hypothetical protein